jgi:diaminopimelate decarboxylase
VRVNPQIEIGSHSTKRHKYGVPMGRARDAIRLAVKYPFLELVGLHFHGGYIYNPKVYYQAAEKLLKLARLAHQLGNTIQFIDLGGGFPVAIGERKVFEPEEFGEDFSNFFARTANELEIPLPTLIFEPGKFITQNAGIGLMKIVSRKQLPFDDVLVTDGSTYSFLPDALIYKERFDFIPATKLDQKPRERYVLAGCTCDSHDVLSKREFLPRMRPDDLLAAMDCGAYSNVLANNFNNLKRAPMVMIRLDRSVKLIRRRDRYSEMFAPELDVLKVADPDELKRYYDLHRVNIDKVWRGGRNSNGSDKK